MKLAKEQIQISGMHCSGCSERVTNVLNQIEGVRSAVVSLEEGEAVVQFDQDQTGFAEMKEAIEKAGYEAEEQ